MEASTLDIIVPEGSAGGSTVSFTDALGTPRQAVVPAGLMPGDVFSVRIDLGDIPMAQLNAGFERSASVSASSALGRSTSDNAARRATALRACCRYCSAADGAHRATASKSLIIAAGSAAGR